MKGGSESCRAACGALLLTVLVLFSGGAVRAEEHSEAKEQSEAEKHSEVALLAGGCFWGMEELLRKLPGVVETEVGYSGGKTERPSYGIVSTGDSGHAETVKVTFDPTKITYEEIIRFFFRIHDPTTLNSQGHDHGTQYRSAIFYTSDAQKQVAETVKEAINKSGKWKSPIVTEITAAGEFYPAESYHQDYLQKHPDGYTCHYVRD